MNSYTYLLRTGCGFCEILLDFSEDVTLDYKSDWMGEGKYHFKAKFNKENINENYGRLKLTSIEGDLVIPDSIIEEISMDEHILIEYFKLPETKNTRIDSTFISMNTMGKAWWN